MWSRLLKHLVKVRQKVVLVAKKVNLSRLVLQVNVDLLNTNQDHNLSPTLTG